MSIFIRIFFLHWFYWMNFCFGLSSDCHQPPLCQEQKNNKQKRRKKENIESGVCLDKKTGWFDVNWKEGYILIEVLTFNEQNKGESHTFFPSSARFFLTRTSSLHDSNTSCLLAFFLSVTVYWHLFNNSVMFFI